MTRDASRAAPRERGKDRDDILLRQGLSGLDVAAVHENNSSDVGRNSEPAGHLGYRATVRDLELNDAVACVGRKEIDEGGA